MITRTSPEGSWVEIINHKNLLNAELRARAYFYEKKGYIVSAVSGMAETGHPTILPSDVANSHLGCCVCDHLLEFSPRSPTGMRDLKLTDWPAYRASGAKSVKSFEASCWMIQIDTVNTAIVITTHPRLSLYPEISVQGTALPRHEDVGAVIRKTLKAAMVLRSNAVI
jgi:hypothetical protein